MGRLVRVFALILVLLLVGVVPGLAQEDAGENDGTAAAEDDAGAGRSTWSVRPADEDGRDGRAWVEHTLEPGEQVEEYLAVRNLGERTETFSISAADGYMTHTGRFNMLPSDRDSVAAGTWIEVQEEVTVAAGDTAVVPYTITVPERVQPGDHPAGIAASVFTGSTDGSGVGVESRVGFRVMVRVPGELTPSLSLGETAVSYSRSWNPFRAGALTVEYVLINDGNVRLEGERHTEVTGPFVGVQGPVESLGELFVDDRRAYATTVGGVWPAFRVRTVVDVLPEPVEGQDLDVDALAVEPLQVEVVAWVIPWAQLIVVAGAVLLALGFWNERRRRIRAWELRLEQARSEGAAAAAAAVAEALGTVDGSGKLKQPDDARPVREDGYETAADADVADNKTKPESEAASSSETRKRRTKDGRGDSSEVEL